MFLCFGCSLVSWEGEQTRQPLGAEPGKLNEARNGEEGFLGYFQIIGLFEKVISTSHKGRTKRGSSCLC